MKRERIQYKPAATSAVAGIVSTQAVAISLPTPQRPLFFLSAAPTPMIDELTTWVVLTGPPTKEAPRMTTDEDNCDANPSIGLIRKNFPPIVRINLQPPTAVPKAIIEAHANITHSGTIKVSNTPPVTNVSVIIPMVFWASFVPWDNAREMDVNIWLRLKTVFTLGEAFQLINTKIFKKRYPNKKPIRGEASRVSKTFNNPGSKIASHPAPTTTAPTKPPTNACDELLGNPRYQVNKFHTMALDKAANITNRLIAAASTTSFPMVSATATPKIKGPKKFAAAVIPRAVRGENALLAIIVATILLESCIPFKKSNMRANMMMMMIKGVIDNIS